MLATYIALTSSEWLVVLHVQQRAMYQQVLGEGLSSGINN